MLRAERISSELIENVSYLTKINRFFETISVKEHVDKLESLKPKIRMIASLFNEEEYKFTPGTNPARIFRIHGGEVRRADSTNGIGDPGSLYKFMRFYKQQVNPSYYKELRNLEKELREGINK